MTKRPVSSAELNEQYGPRLTELLGEDYENHPSYQEIVQEVMAGKRTITNILEDYRRVKEPVKKSARGGW